MRTNATPQSAAAYASSHQQRRKWLTVVTCLAALVVFVTVYALMLPAVAQERETYCGMEEHTHTDACYTTVLTCGQDGVEGHVHDESCYTQELTCGMEEHTHTDACFVAPADGDQATGETAATEQAASTQAALAQVEAETTVLPESAQVPEGYTVQRTVRDEENGFAVTVYAPEGVIPEDAVLSATLLDESSEEYAKAADELAADGVDAQAEGEETSTGFAALDIHLEDADGNEIEPEGSVYVVIDAQGLLPEDADPETVTVQHHAETDSAVTLETVADAASETDGVVAVTDESAVQAAFAVDSFSTFTITWVSGRTTYFQVTVHYVDESGKEIYGPQTTDLTGSSGDYYPFSSFAGDIAGYTYSGAHYNSYNGIEIAYMSFSSTVSGRNQQRTLTFYNSEGTDIWTLTYNNSTQSTAVYLVYTEDSGESIPTSGQVKVYVYVQARTLSDECLRLLGIDSDTIDANGYFPAGEIYLDSSFFENKASASTPGVALINSQDDWEAVLTALGKLDTSTLIDMSTDEWKNYSGQAANGSGALDYSKNINNNVGNYLENAEADINYTWGSMKTALFKWHDDSSVQGCMSYGFADQTVQYHLDLNFSTKNIEYVFGNNGISSGTGRDGTIADTDTQITGTPIQEPDGITIPNGWYFAGYYTDAYCTEGNEWNGIGDPLNQDTTVYIKLVRTQVMTLSINKEIAWADGTTGTMVSDKTYTFTISTTDSTVSPQSYRTSNGNSITFTWDSDSNAYTATVTLTARTQDGADGTVLIYGLPAGEISYTVTEDTSSNMAIDGYTFDDVTYSGGLGENSNTVTGTGTSSTASSSVLATNTYSKVTPVDITFTKVDSDGVGTESEKVLTGAEFLLYKLDEDDTTKLYYSVASDGTVSWNPLDNEDEIEPTTLTEDETTKVFTIYSLEDGTYYLEETKAPDGYQLPSSPITITIDKSKVTYVYCGNTNLTDYIREDGLSFKVTNTTGQILPETGGAGTTFWTISGLLVMAAAVGGGYVLRRRRGREGN